MAAGYGERFSLIAKSLCDLNILKKSCQELFSLFFKFYGLGFEATPAKNHRPNERQFFDGPDDRVEFRPQAMRSVRADEF